ncbi:MAG TPA: RdgB/HAM1 family non-canonical purine NTP pyrophosphatase [Steroidobacteraceae bacterium]|nr:RdgB/HAM1 family non-canonical purine NTP pyrophosphatase [Steroidobacteraceae bacterium]HRX89858.1 RdgB/HAM1 family non-canonical purine NTP pyrophosphatase [Steroidobacteraceae bacterium]
MSPATPVVLASGNRAKLRELSELLLPLGLALLPQTKFGIEPPPETGDSFVDNALLKARNAAKRTSLAALADDSGLEVDALGGLPGVRSARYAGEGATDAENLAKLLLALRDVEAHRRTARYRCAIAFVTSGANSAPIIAEASWEGVLLDHARGNGGFGYDPIFVPSGQRLTVAELPPAAKNAVSHRGRAIAALLQKLAPGAMPA